MEQYDCFVVDHGGAMNMRLADQMEDEAERAEK
jgi:hypothetical protein